VRNSQLDLPRYVRRPFVAVSPPSLLQCMTALAPFARHMPSAPIACVLS